MNLIHEEQILIKDIFNVSVDAKDTSAIYLKDF
jgi:hypothetical protein